jgi:hypothetical protein
VVFVVRGDVADAGVQPDAVVMPPGDGGFSAQDGRVTDREQVRIPGLDLILETLDPGLVGQGAGAGRSAGRSRIRP